MKLSRDGFKGENAEGQIQREETEQGRILRRKSETVEKQEKLSKDKFERESR